MKLLIDDANVTWIKKLLKYYPIDGVTTNPTILSRTGRPPYEALKEIRSLLGDERELHIQVLSSDAEGMVKEAKKIISEIPGNTFIKIPCVPEGFAAMQLLKEEGIHTTGTTVFTPMQALLAAKSGASYVAPYVNRIDLLGFDGVLVAKQIHQILTVYGYPCRVLAASFKNTQQMQELALAGIASITSPPDLIEEYVNNPAIYTSIQSYEDNFARVYGEGLDMTKFD